MNNFQIHELYLKLLNFSNSLTFFRANWQSERACEAGERASELAQYCATACWHAHERQFPNQSLKSWPGAPEIDDAIDIVLFKISENVLF